MKYLIFALLSLSACQAPPTAVTASPLKVSSISTPQAAASPVTVTCSSLGMQALGGGNGCIDTMPRAARIYSDAANTCALAGLSVCTHDLYGAAQQHGHIAVPDWFWEMPYAGTNQMIDNTLYASNAGNSDQQQLVGQLQKFYCCGAGL